MDIESKDKFINIIKDGLMDLADGDPGLKGFDIESCDAKLKQLFSYYEMLIEVNKSMNLTRITDVGEAAVKHFLDSLSLVKCSSVRRCLESLILENKVGMRKTYKLNERVIPEEQNKPAMLSRQTGHNGLYNDPCNYRQNCDWIDIGTGAGFPGLVLKIVFPEINMYLNDSVKKKLAFIDEVITKLGLSNVKTIHSRAEDLGRLPEFRGHFAFAVSRAVANLSTLSEYCVPLLNKGGNFIAMKSVSADKELKDAKPAIEKLGGKIIKKVEFTLPGAGLSMMIDFPIANLSIPAYPGMDLTRTLIAIQKKKATPSIYPRKAGTPSRDPLK